jgi:hypothetical protein
VAQDVETAAVREQKPRASGAAAVHRPFAIITLVAVALRIVVMLGYPPIMWFNDSYYYISDAVYRGADTMRPEGYPFFLAVLEPLHSLALVSVLQAAMGVAMGVATYALLYRRGLPRWGATLAAAGVLFDSYELLLEHLLGADALFTCLVTLAVIALCWNDLPGWRAVVAAGLAIGCADTVRSVGYPLLAVIAVTLLLRAGWRGAWRRAVALVVAGIVPIAGYMLWFHGQTGRFGLTESQGTFLYGRVSSFAECQKMNPPASLRVLCDSRPPSERQGAESYIWDGGTPLAALSGPNSANRFTPSVDSLARRFALRAIESQPLDYAAVVVHDTLRTFGWTRWSSDAQGSGPTFQFRSTATPVPYWATNYPGNAAAQKVYSARVRYAGPGGGGTRVTGPWAAMVRVYAGIARFPGTLLGVAMLIGLAAMAARWRRRGGLVPMPWLAAATLVVLPPMTAGFSYRYVAAAVPLACLAAALSFAPGPGDPGAVLPLAGSG